MTTLQARKIAEAAGLICFYDPSIRLWTVYREEPYREARYYTAAVIADMTRERFVSCYVDD